MDINTDQIVVKAIIPAAAGKPVQIVALNNQHAPVDAEFNEDGELVHESWTVPGVVLPCDAAVYRFIFDDPAVEDFAVRVPGVGGGVANVEDLERYEGERGYARGMAASFSDAGTAGVVTEEAVTQQERAEHG